jgi:anti-anti-sigma factor
MAGHTGIHTIDVFAFFARPWSVLALRQPVEPRGMCKWHLPRTKPIRHPNATSHADASTMVARLQASIRLVMSHGLCIGVVPLAGELSMHTVTKVRPYLKTFVHEQGLSGYIFDLSHVTQIDTAGIALLIELVQWCRQRQAVYACTNPSPMAQHLMELTYVSSILNVHASIHQALTACGQSGRHHNAVDHPAHVDGHPHAADCCSPPSSGPSPSTRK